MHTPTAALAWEFWRRHRKRLIIVAGIVLAFAMIYPKLCALAGFNRKSADAMDELGRFAVPRNGPPTALQIVQILYFLFLASGPMVAMLLTLLFAVWIFTFTEFDPKGKDPMAFPVRLFTLPVSTPFLFWRLWAGSMAGILVLYASWVYWVRPPHVGTLAVFDNCFLWMTLLALTQGIAWALAAWPLMRTFLLIALLFGFFAAPSHSDFWESPLMLLPLFLFGTVVARAGLQKMRHGQWQGWPWRWPLLPLSTRAQLRGPKRFASSAQAQLWFEWRRFGRRASLMAAALALVPVAIHVLVRVLARLGPLEGDTMNFFAGYLVAMPVFIYFVLAISPGRAELPFLMIRPQTNGEMMMAILKATAISAVLAWLAVFAALWGLLPLLGDFHAVEQSVSVHPSFRVALVLGLMFLTWRMPAVNLCFTLSGKRRLAEFPALMLAAACPVGLIVAWLANHDEYWVPFMRVVPGLLTGLVVVKFVLAFLAFRVSLQRNLLAPSAMTGYLTVWLLFVAVFLSILFIIQPPRELMVPLSLWVVLLVPLARIGLCPITLSWNRHP